MVRTKRLERAVVVVVRCEKLELGHHALERGRGAAAARGVLGARCFEAAEGQADRGKLFGKVPLGGRYAFAGRFDEEYGSHNVFVGFALRIGGPPES